MYKDRVCNLPFLSEGIDEVTVVRLLVKKGDFISSVLPIIEVETDKAMIEFPIDLEGEIIEWFVKPGDKVAVGDPICSVHSFQGPSSEEFRKFYLETTRLIGLPSTSSLDDIRAEIEKMISRANC